jgi:DNA replication protein DnaC
MLWHQTAFREVMRAYETDRNRAEALLDRRRAEVYEKIPCVTEIEKRISDIGLQLVKLALGEDNNPLAALRAESRALQAEKAELLRQTGIPADYLTAVYQCQFCADTGYINRPDGRAERCSCLKQRLVEAYYKLSNVKHILSHENFDTFDLRLYDDTLNENEGLSPYANMQTVYHAAMQFVQRFKQEFQNLLLYGDTGLGKTFLCHCLAKDLLDQGHTVLYVTAPQLFRVIENYRFNRDEMDAPDEMLDTVMDVDLLIIDDLGAEFSTIVTSTALFDIINQRLLSQKPIVISTNLSHKSIESQYSDRITSRLWGHYKLLKFFGDDIRVKKKYAAISS